MMTTSGALSPTGSQSGPPAAALLRVLVRREWRAPRLYVLLLLGIALAVTAGWSAAALGEPQATTGGLWYAPENMARHFGAYTAALFAVLGALGGLNRVADDHKDPWLVPLVALSDARRRYPAFLYCSIVSVHVAAYTVLLASFAVAATASGASFVKPSVRWLIGGGASIASASAYGLALGLLCKARGAAVLTGLVALALPFLLSLVHLLRTDALPPAWLHRLLYLHLPPLSQSVTGSVLLQHLAYVLLLLLLLHRASNRLVARYR